MSWTRYVYFYARERGSASVRSSNIKLLRIVGMLAIIAHHYVVNLMVKNPLVSIFMRGSTDG